MNLNDNMNKYLMGKIELLPHDVFNFTKIAAIDFLSHTEKAGVLLFNLEGEERTRWIPLSQLRKDKNNNLWLANWLLEKIKTDGKND